MEGTASQEQQKTPSVFISYSHDSDDHRDWVESFASELRKHGVKTVLDQWDLELGDNIPFFIETAIRENDFTLVICTPRYKEKSESREGGVGYETYIITTAWPIASLLFSVMSSGLAYPRLGETIEAFLGRCLLDLGPRYSA